jgi:hypothetical protein
LADALACLIVQAARQQAVMSADAYMLKPTCRPTSTFMSGGGRSYALTCVRVSICNAGFHRGEDYAVGRSSSQRSSCARHQPLG